MNENNKQFSGIDYQVGVGNVLGDDNLFKEILQMFYDDHHQDVENIQRAIDNGDDENLKRLVHTLKGVACSIGAMTLFETTKLLDIAINDNQGEDYQKLFDDVAAELTKVIGGIKEALAA